MATILVVDDLILNRRLLAGVLALEGHRLLEAADGRAGLVIARTEHPDLVITDVLMPVVDGYEFVRQLRQDPLTSDIPVLFYTAPYGEREARALARANGVPYVLTKPPESEEVLRVVGRVLAGDLVDDPAEGVDATDNDADREQLRLLGDQLLETTEELRQANARLRALINIGLDYASQRDTDRRVRRLCHAVHDLFGATSVTVGLLSLPDRRIRRVVASGMDTPSWIEVGDLPSGIFATVVEGRRSIRGSVAPTDPDSLSFPGDHPEVQTFLVAPLASAARVYGWICLVGNDGVTFTAEAEQQVLALAGKVGRIYELEYEIAERVSAEAALRQSEQLIRTLVEHLPHRIALKDRESVVTFCNANYADDLGLAIDEVIGRPAGHSTDQTVLTSGTGRSVEASDETHGQTRWTRTVTVPYREAGGEATGVLVVAEDVTEQHAREEQYQQAEKMEAFGRLAGGVAHDFNNLLTAILGYCELIADDLEPQDPRRGDVEEIRSAGLRAAGLTRQLLAFSRKEIIKPVVFDLNTIVTDLRPMLARVIREDVKVVVRLAAVPTLVEADRGQVEQIVLNLVLNARDAMPTGGTLTIETVRLDLDEHYTATHPSVVAGPHVGLIVTDTGSGMPPEVLARVFEPFFTTKPLGQGTGLGLASVQGIVARSGGSVEVYSEPGRGTAFKVYFPEVDATVSASTVPTAVPAPLVGTETILIVDDAEPIRILARRLLERQGYRVLLAGGAADAMRVFRQDGTIDVLLTDVVMPDGSGPDLARKLVELRPSLQVIYMSGYTEDTIVRHGVLLPGIAFLPKPFTAESLGRKVRSVVDSSTQTDAGQGLHKPENAQQPPDDRNHDHHVEDGLDR
jgi:PAS domain S-box-containing protein